LKKLDPLIKGQISQEITGKTPEQARVLLPLFDHDEIYVIKEEGVFNQIPDADNPKRINVVVLNKTICGTLTLDECRYLQGIK
jgi:hypothetical protein